MSYGTSTPSIRASSTASDDGQRFVFARLSGGELGRNIILVVNWLEELKVKVGN